MDRGGLAWICRISHNNAFFNGKEFIKKKKKEREHICLLIVSDGGLTFIIYGF